jgi:hypothetical protein
VKCDQDGTASSDLAGASSIQCSSLPYGYFNTDSFATADAAAVAAARAVAASNVIVAAATPSRPTSNRSSTRTGAKNSVRSMSQPKVASLTAVKRIWAYLSGTKTNGIV